MRRGAGVCAVVAIVVLAPACNSSLLRPPATVAVDGGGALISTTEVEEREEFTTVLFSYLPSVVPLHPGDAVDFDLEDTGEPHTVALGTMVEDALDAVAALDSGPDLQQIESLDEMRALPSVFPLQTGGGPINASATRPCFLTSGAPPTSADGGAPPCDEAEKQPFTGRESFYASGILTSEEAFRVDLDGEIEPGTYRFMCLVHRTAMTGEIEVRPTEVERPTVAEVKQDGEDQRDQIRTGLEGAVNVAVQRDLDSILAGAGVARRAAGVVSAFIPERLKVSTDEPVTWRFREAHTISFGAPRPAKEGLFVIEDGQIELNDQAFEPTGGSPEPPEEARGYFLPAEGLPVDGGTYDGEGFFSSGLLRGMPSGEVRYTLRFSEPGIYRYDCLVHPEMRGEIVVGTD